ncbi:hypothetical protein ANN_06825 [Periplaneta americana]|uniref:Transposase n=1 Tax=Periplaneta americana TaxID=6978 RepID=A0ABQ8TFX5_PERAM|nr:hypothetical protein ANN_06825 [Periplaneta americana]
MDTKAKVTALIEERGMSAASAGERYGLHPRTASRWLKQYQERGYLTRKPKSGRPRISNPEQDAALIAALKQPLSLLKSCVLVLTSQDRETQFFDVLRH